MKYIILLFTISVLAACSSIAEVNYPDRRVPQTLTHKAYYYYGLQEVKDRQLIKEITGVDPVTTEWCAAFVNMVLLENNLPQSSTVSSYPLMARSFLEWGTPVDKPEKGDILVFERGNSGWQGHVAFYVSTDIVDGEKYYTVLGGNQNNSVSIEKYSASKLLSIRRLDLDSISDPSQVNWYSP